MVDLTHAVFAAFESLARITRPFVQNLHLCMREAHMSSEETQAVVRPSVVPTHGLVDAAAVGTRALSLAVPLHANTSELALVAFTWPTCSAGTDVSHLDGALPHTRLSLQMALAVMGRAIGATHGRHDRRTPSAALTGGHAVLVHHAALARYASHSAARVHS